MNNIDLQSGIMYVLRLAVLRKTYTDVITQNLI
jgi:hypothetical protein